MYLKSSQKLENSRFELEIEVSPEEFAQAIDKTYFEEKNKINVAGFRKGRAPRSVVEKYYGEEIFFEGAINSLYPKAVDDAIKSLGLEFVEDKVDFELINANKKDGLIFKTKITVVPEVTIENYKGIEAQKRQFYVTEEDFNNEVASLRESVGRIVTADRAVQINDFVNIDFKVEIDEKEIEDGSAKNYQFRLGKKQFMQEVENQLIGHFSGDEFKTEISLPKDYHVKNFAGKTMVFEIKINEVKELILPELDDEFAKNVSEFENFEDFKKDTMKKVEQKKQDESEREVDSQIYKKLSELVKADIPEALIKTKQNKIVKEFETHELGKQNIKLETYLKVTGMTADEFAEKFRNQAEEHVKIDLALCKIAKLENLEATDEDIKNKYEELAKYYKVETKVAERIVPREELIKEITIFKAFEFVKQNAVITSA